MRRRCAYFASRDWCLLDMRRGLKRTRVRCVARMLNRQVCFVAEFTYVCGCSEPDEDETMNAAASVKTTNDDVRSTRSTSATPALNGGNRASQTRYRRPHAPQSGTPKKAALIDFSFDIGSTNELPIGTTHVLLRPDRAFNSRPLDRIRTSYRRRIEYSRTDPVCQIQCPMYRPLCSGDPRHSLPALSVDAHSGLHLGADRIRKYTQLRSRSRVDSAQTMSNPGLIPRRDHRIVLTNIRLAVTMTRVPEHLTRNANHSVAHQNSRNNY